MSYGAYDGCYRVTLLQSFGRLRLGKPIELRDGTRIDTRELPVRRLHLGPTEDTTRLDEGNLFGETIGETR
jgi:hypothetical protein